MILMGKSERGQWGIAKTKIVYYYTNSPYERSSLCLDCNLSILWGKISKFLIYCD